MNLKPLDTHACSKKDHHSDYSSQRSGVGGCSLCHSARTAARRVGTRLWNQLIGVGRRIGRDDKSRLRGIGTDAISGARSAVNEDDVSTVVQGGAGLAHGNDLDAGIGAIVGDETLRKLEQRETKGAVAGHVEKLGRERNVEVGHIVAEAEVDKDVGPGVVQLEGHGAADEGPLGAVPGSIGDIGAFGVEFVSVKCSDNKKREKSHF